jgi:Tfp pilus assembly protein PilN
MKRLNLLPPELRPRDGSRRGVSYVVVGALAAAVVGMFAYGMVMSGVRSDETELVQLKDEAAEAQARADALSPYGAFADMKDRRERSVRLVAETRFDYERLTRELARILPDGVWVGHLEVAPAPPAQDVVAAGADPVDGTAPVPPAMTVSGCAPGQDVVADTLDRLRALTGATDVALGSSSQSGADASSASGGGEPRLVSGSSGGCGQAGRPRVAFDATVTLTAPGVEQDVTTPAAETAASTTGTGS